MLSWSRTTDKLAINGQNFAPVGLQLKFAFKKERKKFIFVYNTNDSTR